MGSMVAEVIARDELCMDMEALNATTAYAKLREPVIKFKMMIGMSIGVTKADKEFATPINSMKRMALIKCNTVATAERAVAAMNALHPSNGGPLGPQHKIKLPEMIPRMLPKMPKGSFAISATTMFMVAKMQTAIPR